MQRALVLQPHLGPALAACDMGPFGPCLVVAPPGGPVQDMFGGWWRLPDEREEQMPHLGHGQRQQR